ncbi:serine/threonine protein phosphatase [Arthrospira sp. O9.13F]|nr:serine/threonine protein phosphatase [Arthrospira sp. O9.13F]
MNPNSAYWQIISASVAGTSHEKQAIPCQDAHIYREIDPHQFIVAVADGAGSASLADVGAQLAVKTATQLIEEYLSSVDDTAAVDWNSQLLAVVSQTKQAIEAEADHRDILARELATTLILGVITASTIAVVQIGDGAVVVETTFLVSPNALESAQIQVWSGMPKYLAIFSDGLQMLGLKMPEGKPHAPFFSPLFQFVETICDRTEAEQQLISFLRSPRVNQRTDDDLTLILAAKMPSSSQ